MNHPLIGNFLEDKDDELIEHLKALDIKIVDDLGSFRVELVRFGSSRFLSVTSLGFVMAADVTPVHERMGRRSTRTRS